ncbi:MAG: hypothetical protein ACRDY0_08925, partial [Acidimicrobiales bacterium]
MVPPDEDSLRHLLGPADELPGGPDELRGIVARAGRRWRRTAAAGMALTLAAGAGAGYLVARQSSPAPTTVAVGAASSSTTVARSQVAAAPGAAGGAVPGAAGGAVPGGGALAYPWPPGQAGPPSYTLLFVRSSGPVAVRGFLTNFPQPAGVPAPCGWLGGPAFVADVSTAKMVGQAFAGFGTSDRSKPISADSVSVLGQAEADPTLVVVVATGSGVATVRVAFAGGATDQTAPVKGWVALASQVGSALA